MPNKRVEVDLYLRANTDLKRLQSALDGFGRDLGGIGGGGADSVVINKNATTEGMDANREKQRTARGTDPGGVPFGPVGRLLGLQAGAGMMGNFARAMNPINSPLGEALAFGPQMLGSLARVGGMAENIGTGGGFTQFGGQQGLSMQGGIRSAAFRAGVGNTLSTYGQAFGIGQPGGTSFNSFIGALQNQNLGDIKALRGSLGSMGWGNAQLDRFSQGGSSNQLSLIPTEMRADLFNSTRYGTASITGLSTQLRQMATDASAAHMGVTQFSQSVQEVIQSLGGQFGTPQSAALGAARGAALATGLAPSIALSGVNQMTMYQSLAQHAGGANPFLNTFGRAGGIEGAAMNSYNMIVRISGLGQTLDDAKKFLQANGRDATLNALWKSYEFARSMWPQNMTPPMFMQIIGRGTAGVQAGFKLSHDVQRAMGASSAHPVSSSLMHNIESEGIAALGGGNKAAQLIHNAVAQGGDRMQIAHRIQSIVAKANNQQTNQQAGGKFTIGLSSQAAQALNIQPADSGTRNNSKKVNGGTAITFGYGSSQTGVVTAR